MLKWLALLFMLIDHLAYYLYPLFSQDVYLIMRTIGRLAFPIFAYGIVLGIKRSRNVSRYFVRLSIFAILGQIIMEAAARYTSRTTFINVLFTLAAGLLLIVGMEFISKSMQDVVVSMRPVAVGPNNTKNNKDLFNIRVNLKGFTLPSWQGILIGGALCISAILIVVILEPDYGLFGLIVMLLFYFLENQLEPYSPSLSKELKLKRHRTYFLAFGSINIINAILSIAASPENKTWAIISLFSTFSVFFFHFQSKEGRRPKPWEKYFFYVFYPLHIALLMYIASQLGL